MEKKTTAEEFFKGKSDSFDTQMRRETFYQNTVKQLMIEFAKFHVEQALKAASKEAYTRDVPFSDDVEVDPDSILESYPLENIK